MSASSLPVEIWLAVLEFATHTSNLLLPEIYSDSGGCDEDRLEQLRQSLVIKRAIVSVCKQWRTLGTPLLYRCLLLQHSTHITLLTGSLLRRQGPSEFTLGSLVQRLVISLDIESTDSSLLPTILRRLPNLVVLDVDDYTNAWPLSATDALIDTCAQSLQVFRWRALRGISEQAFSRLLRGCPKLHFLMLHALWNSLKHERKWEPSSSLESLTFLDTLSPDNWMGHLADMALPSLRKARLWGWDPDSPDSQRFLTVHGKQLTHLVMRPGFMQKTLDLIRDVCPRMQVLEFHVYFWDSDSENWFGSQSMVLPRIKELWIHCDMNPRHSVSVAGFVLFFLKRLASADQLHLEAVRLLSRDGFPHLMQEHLRLLADCRARVPVYLSDHNGVRLPL